VAHVQFHGHMTRVNGPSPANGHHGVMGCFQALFQCMDAGGLSHGFIDGFMNAKRRIHDRQRQGLSDLLFDGMARSGQIQLHVPTQK